MRCESNFSTLLFFTNEYFQTYCEPRCPVECHKSILTKTIVSNIYPSSSASELLNSSNWFNAGRATQIDYINKKEKNILRIIIFLSSLSYTNVEEDAKMTLDNLIGTIGGHLHLYKQVMNEMNLIKINECHTIINIDYILDLNIFLAKVICCKVVSYSTYKVLMIC